ncbi:MAG: acylneuraminate cytidylyltransferase family protein [Candidatus Pacebacteria bacterium]|jgi:CMP-N-acetylneuraminic acid synthetase|nr:acylneuraminate cytidylyltransferase family protein [Candidatus Paceibacterota bacterium]
MKTLAVIPARAGSKGIPKKNIISVGGKPLMAWTIESAFFAGVERVFVSSDSDEILEMAKKYGAETIRRPQSLSGDKISSESAIWHALDYLKKREKYVPDMAMLLQPTSPLRGSKDIKNAIKFLAKDKVASALISVCEADNKYLKSFLLDKNNYMHGVHNDKFPFVSRQLLPKLYMPNGAIYIVRKEVFKRKSLFTKNTIPYVMPKERSVDIDTIEDIVILEKYLRNM